jgi:hypothetical protein
VTTWRAYIGHDPHSPKLDATGLTWEQARQKLLDHARGVYADNSGPDGCTYCRGYAEDAIIALAAVRPDTEWTGDLEIDDLRLTWQISTAEPVVTPVVDLDQQAWPAGWAQIGATEDRSR